MNILFLGEGKLAYECLKVLMGENSFKNFKVMCVVSSDNFYSNFVKDADPNDQITFISNKSRNEDLITKQIDNLQVELIISVQHKWILSDKIIKRIKGKAFNLHNAKLPEYKGYNSISHAIFSNETNYFVTIHKIEAEVDKGSIILELEIKISPDETALSLYKKTIPVAGLLFKNFLSLLSEDALSFKSQVGKGTFYHKSSLDKMRRLNLSDSEETLSRKIRAVYFPPYEPAYFFINKQKFYCLPNNLESNVWLKEVPENKSKWD